MRDSEPQALSILTKKYKLDIRGLCNFQVICKKKFDNSGYEGKIEFGKNQKVVLSASRCFSSPGCLRRLPCVLYRTAFTGKKNGKEDAIFVCGHTVRSGLSCPFGRMQ